LNARKIGSAVEEMNVRIVEARHYSFTGQVDYLRIALLEGRDRGGAAHCNDAIPADRDGLYFRLLRINSPDLPVDQDQIDGRLCDERKQENGKKTEEHDKSAAHKFPWYAARADSSTDRDSEGGKAKG
ncbi:MAG: hypothetical protein WBW33_01175, partial [Bryobacteraceae bacterium]